jgi:hypothetical protein
MAFRFRREGDFVKHRIHMERMGMQPWLEDFKWRAVNWHYELYMQPKARQALRNQTQDYARHLQRMYDYMHCGKSTKNLDKDISAVEREKDYLSRQSASRPDKFMHDTRYFVWRPAVPNIVPNRVSTNPFCPVSANKTGWREQVKRLIPEPKPRGKRNPVAGTDDAAPVMPRV